MRASQEKKSGKLYSVKENDFPSRLRIAFDNDNNAEIARKIGVSAQSVGDYMKGTLPNGNILIRIRESSKADLNWLLTGEGEKKETIALQQNLHQNTATEGKKDETVELKLSGDYEIKLAPNRIEIRGTIKSLQRRT